MSGLLFWLFLVAASVGFVWSLLQADPFIDQIDRIINKLGKDASHDL